MMARLARFLAKAFVILLPVAGFAWVVGVQVRGLMDEGKGLLAIVWMLGALAVLAGIEAVLFKCWLLPRFAQGLGERLYAGGGYLAAEDPLQRLVERVREEKSRERLAELEKLVHADARRARAWQEYANVLNDVFHEAPAAVSTLREGAARVAGKEDRAMLLCRAAHMALEGMGDRALAQELYREAAGRYPRTAYGKFAAGKLAKN